jgi:hypothetical protein
MKKDNVLRLFNIREGEFEDLLSELTECVHYYRCTHNLERIYGYAIDASSYGDRDDGMVEVSFLDNDWCGIGHATYDVPVKYLWDEDLQQKIKAYAKRSGK